MLQGDWGVGERLALRFVAPMRDITASGRLDFDSSGLGDVEAWARWGLGPELGAHGGALGAGLALPTGRDVRGELTEDNSVAFGAGDITALVSAEGFRRLTAAHTVFGLIRYRYPLGSGERDYRFADDLGWSGIWRWTPGSRRVSVSLGLSGQYLGQDEQAGVPVDSRGGRLHHALGGVTVPAGSKGSIGVLVQRLVERHVRGDQLLSPWNLVVGYSVSWGKHVHDESEHARHAGASGS